MPRRPAPHRAKNLSSYDGRRRVPLTGQQPHAMRPIQRKLKIPLPVAEAPRLLDDGHGGGSQSSRPTSYRRPSSRARPPASRAIGIGTRPRPGRQCRDYAEFFIFNFFNKKNNVFFFLSITPSDVARSRQTTIEFLQVTSRIHPAEELRGRK